MLSENMYTQEQLDIELLKNTNNSIVISLTRLENAIQHNSNATDTNFKWTLGLMLGIYAIVISGLLSAIGKVYGVI